MMRIKVLYFGLLRKRAGISEEEYDIQPGSTLADLYDKIVERHGEGLRNVLVADKESHLDPTFIVTLNSSLIDSNHASEIGLKMNDIIALLTLISGG